MRSPVAEAAPAGLNLAVTAQAGLGLPSPVGHAAGSWISETSGFHLSHLNRHRIAGRIYRELRAWARWGHGWGLCFGGAGLWVLGCAQYEGDGVPCASASRVPGWYRGADVSGRAEGDRRGGLPPITLSGKPTAAFTGTSEKHGWEHTCISLSAVDSGVPWQPVSV